MPTQEEIIPRANVCTWTAVWYLDALIQLIRSLSLPIDEDIFCQNSLQFAHEFLSWIFWYEGI